MNAKDELFVFAAEDNEQPSTNSVPPWSVLLVDDEPDVHVATKLALKNLSIEGAELSFSHAYSKQEAIDLLKADDSFAVAIIDVVMENEQAGLELIHYIRHELQNSSMRIILRTGQPGYAPEISTIQDYDINDYRTKTELTQTRLFTSLTMAVRSYAQICQLEAGRKGLEKILEATSEMSKPCGLDKFSDGLVSQLCALLKIKGEVVICAAMMPDAPAPYVVAAAGSYKGWVGMPLLDIPNMQVRQSLEQSLEQQAHAFEHGLALFFRGVQGQALVAYVNVQRSIDTIERCLLEVFCSNMSVAFANLQLYLDVEKLAFRDVLVGLPNRNAMLNELERRAPGVKVLALVDLDNFADINSILDEVFGDEVLKAVAERLRTSLSDDTRVARLGNDLFALFGSQDEVNPEQIQKLFAEPFVLHASEGLRLSATSGLVLVQDQPAAELLKNAGAALKQAKRMARGKALYFKDEQSAAARNRIHLLSSLRSALLEQRLELFFQPFVRLRDRKIIGAECLLRWRTDDGFVPPDEFIPVAEQSGLMIALGEWVIRTALAWRHSLLGVVDDSFRVAINISNVQFAEPDFVPVMLKLLNESGVPGSMVELELTESVAIENIERLLVKLEQLQQQGIHIALDDFGTGYSSLSVLKRLPLDRLKIDRSFVSGDGTESADGNFDMASTIAAMASHLHLKTIAEGIESEEQCAALQAAGCEDGQGYWFSKPLPADEFAALLAGWQQV